MASKPNSTFEEATAFLSPFVYLQQRVLQNGAATNEHRRQNLDQSDSCIDINFGNNYELVMNETDRSSCIVNR